MQPGSDRQRRTCALEANLKGGVAARIAQAQAGWGKAGLWATLEELWEELNSKRGGALGGGPPPPPPGAGGVGGGDQVGWL